MGTGIITGGAYGVIYNLIALFDNNFSLKRYDVFPIDVWVRRVMNDLYIHNEDEEKVSKKELQKLAQDKFLGISGLAQQYLFYWRREQGN